MHVAVTLIFIVCIGYLAKSGGHLLLRVEIEVMLDGEYWGYNKIFMHKSKYIYYLWF